MSATGHGTDLDIWLNLSESLSPLQNFGLIGFLRINPGTLPSIINTDEVTDREYLESAALWATTNLRTPLDFVCKEFAKTRAKVAAELASQTSEAIELDTLIRAAIKYLAPSLLSLYSVPLGIGVALLYMLVKESFETWCRDYSERKYTGEGVYRRDSPLEEYPAYFELTYRPPIVRHVGDPAAYPLMVQKELIDVPAETKGKCKLQNEKSAETIFNMWGLAAKSFTFADYANKKTVAGRVKFALTPDFTFPNVFPFEADHPTFTALS